MVNLIYSLNGTHLFPNLTFLWFLSMKMAKTLKSVLQYCILDFHVDHFWLKNHLLNLKGNKDIGQIWMKPVFHVETQITFLALKTTKFCLNQYCFSRKVGIGWSRTKSCTGASTTRWKSQSKMLRISSIDSESKQRFLGAFGVVNSRTL